MRYLFVISTFITLLWSCTSTKPIVDESVPSYPHWLLSRPISESNYIGIAKASKSSGDYQTIAKQNALMDLSSEISVKLNSESILHQVDKGQSYREEYQSLIQMQSHKELEGYKLVASWEDDKDYYLYYTLSKYEWEQIRVTRKANALEQAYTFYQLAIAESAKDKAALRVHYAVKALDRLKMYMNESLWYEGLDKPLDILCFEMLSDVHSSIGFEMHQGMQEREIVLMGKDISLEEFEVDVTSVGLPFKVRSSMKGIPDQLSSNDDGLLVIQASAIDVYRKEHFIHLQFDWKSLIEETTAESWVISLLDFPEKTFEIKVNAIWPKLAINSEELNLGEPMDQAILLNASSNFFRKKGFEFVDASEADYIISIQANTSRGLHNNRMHTALLYYQFEVNDASGELVFQKQMRELKGVQASFPSAGINAYERSLEDFSWDVLRPFIKLLEGTNN